MHFKHGSTHNYKRQRRYTQEMSANAVSLKEIHHTCSCLHFKHYSSALQYFSNYRYFIIHKMLRVRPQWQDTYYRAPKFLQCGIRGRNRGISTLTWNQGSTLNRAEKELSNNICLISVALLVTEIQPSKVLVQK